MKKVICIILALLIILPALGVPVKAADNAMTFAYELTVDGKNTKEVETGDIITVVLRLKRSDAQEPYTMYAMQDEIRYDSRFFELVENSAILREGIQSTDIAMVDHNREFYMNYLSMGGGSQWGADELIGSFQLRVIGSSGVTVITNEDALVSYKDGTGSYTCSVSDVTIIISADCTIQFESNGGTEIEDQIVRFGEKIIRPQDPVREGYRMEGWYKDIHLTDLWDFENDIVEGNMSLYAKWVVAEPEPEPDNGLCWLWLLLLLILLLIVILIITRKKKKKEDKKTS